MKKWMKTLVIALFLAVLPGSLMAGEINTDKDNKAIDGYDPVAYFLADKAVKGMDRYSLEWKGAVWNFSSEENKDLFSKHPEDYAPNYGGHCANGLSDHHKIAGNPNIWLIQEGELFFFFSRRGRSAWIKDTKNKRQLADAYWKSVQFE